MLTLRREARAYASSRLSHFRRAISALKEKSGRQSVGTYRHVRHAEALHLLGEYDRELAAIRLAQRDVPGMFGLLAGEARASAALGRVEEVMKVIDHSLSLTPTSGTAGEVMLRATRELLAHGQVEASRALAARAVDCHRRRLPQPASPAAQAALGHAAYLAGDWREAGQGLSTSASPNPRPVDSTGYLGLIAARRGEVARARAIAEDLNRVHGRKIGALAMLYRARIAAALGDSPGAVAPLREALGRGGRTGVFLHHIEDFEPLRDYELFVDLLRPKG